LINTNLTDNCIKNKEVELVHVHTIYSEPPKSDKKELIKAFATIFKSDSNAESLIVAQFVNTKDNIEPHIVIGLQVKTNFDHYAAIVEKQFYKRFYKHVYYELLNLTKEPEQKELLKEQGYIIRNW